MTNLKTSTLRPGLLVAVKTSIKGNVTYSKSDLDFLRIEKGSKATWETERTVLNEEEQERASKVRSKARSLIASVCSSTDFGYLCPEFRKADLDAAIEEAKKEVAAFNETAQVTRVRFRHFCGRVADNDVDAVKAINAEVRELLEEMAEGVKNFDVDRIRKAAGSAVQIGQMLAPDAEVRVKLAVDAARDTAKKLVKAGEAAAKEIDRVALQRLTEARTAFLDLDDAAEVKAPDAIGARAIDLDLPVGSYENDAEVALVAAQLPRKIEVGEVD